MGTHRCGKISIPCSTVNSVMVNKPANYQLRNIGKITRFLNTDTIKSAIIALVTSRLGYCNGPLCGITDEALCRLQ